MEGGLNPNKSRKPVSRLRKTLGAGLIVLGLAIMLGPVAIFLFMTVSPFHFSDSTILLWHYLSAFGLLIYVPVGLVTIIIGFFLRQADGWIIGIGLTITAGAMALFIYQSQSILRYAPAKFWQWAWVSHGFMLLPIGLGIIGIGLWIRRRSLR
jgi:hypothetical protein